ATTNRWWSVSTWRNWTRGACAASTASWTRCRRRPEPLAPRLSPRITSAGVRHEPLHHHRWHATVLSRLRSRPAHRVRRLLGAGFARLGPIHAVLPGTRLSLHRAGPARPWPFGRPRPRLPAGPPRRRSGGTARTPGSARRQRGRALDGQRRSHALPRTAWPRTRRPRGLPCPDRTQLRRGQPRAVEHGRTHHCGGARRDLP